VIDRSATLKRAAVLSLGQLELRGRVATTRTAADEQTAEAPDAPQEDGDALVEGLQHAVQDELVLVLAPGHVEHEVAQALVHHQDVVKHHDLGCGWGCACFVLLRRGWW